MTVRRRCVRAAIVAGVLLAVGRPADAACTISTTPLQFGTYDAVIAHATAPLDSSTTIRYRCDDREPITITISGGLNSGIDPRRLFRDGNIASTDTLQYNLFLDAGRTTIWGDGTAGQVHTNPRPFRNRNIDVPVFGRVFGGQDPRVGSYSNSLVVTINF